jgi:hypothetical protein
VGAKESGRRTKEYPNLIEGGKIPILGRGQIALGVGMGLFTRKKRKKTGLVNTDKPRSETDSLHVFLPAHAYLTYPIVRRLWYKEFRADSTSSGRVKK